MTRRKDELSGFDDRVWAALALPPVQGLERLVRAWLDYLPEIQPVANALEAARVTDPAGAAAWQERMTDLRGAF
jgi:hypothetical protein